MSRSVPTKALPKIWFLASHALAAALAFQSLPAMADPVIEPLTPAEQADSARPDPARLLGFDEAIGAIVDRSTGVAIQRANLGATVERNRPAALAFVPDLALDAKQTSVRGAGLDDFVASRQLEAVSTVNLFRGGADYKAVLAARRDEDASRALVEQSILQAEAEAVSALVAEIARRQDLGILSRIVELQEQALRIARERYARGLLPLQEADKISVDLSNARARLADARIQAIQASAALESLLGGARVSAEWPWKARLSAFAPASGGAATLPESSLASALSRRPDWRAAQSRVEAEEERLSRNWRLLLPSLDGSLAYGYYRGQGAETGGTALQGTLLLTIPIFDRLVNFSNARAQSQVRAAAEAQLEQVRRNARAEWRAANGAFETALASALERERTKGVSLKLYQDNLRRFQAGRASANELILDQGRLYESELLEVQGWSSAHLAYARRCHAQGLRLSDCR